MSRLMEHAEREMKLAGLYDKDADYDGQIPKAVMALVKAHSEQGHSGMSHAITLEIFNKVINYQPLTPLTDNPKDWILMAHGSVGTVWMNVRQTSAYSTDGGKTWYSVDDPHRTVNQSATRKK